VLNRAVPMARRALRLRRVLPKSERLHRH
jgi:hypothetical protein